MNVKVSAPPGAVPWDEVRGRLDQNEPFSNMFDTPLYRDAVWEQFSREEYARRHAALRAKMREHKLDVVIVPGGPSHWSFGGGMTWLTGHWEWHAISSYVVVPLEAEPTLIFSMGGTHAEAVRRQVEPALSDVRQSRGGRYAEVMVERIRELGLTKPRIGLVEIDPRHKDYMPVNQYNDLRDGLPDAEIVFTRSFIHELVIIKSEAELDCVRRAGVLCQHAMEAMVAAAKPGATVVDLLRELGLDSGRVAIERNLEILPRPKWAETNRAPAAAAKNTRSAAGQNNSAY
jgi:Xaa-Pro aminopeptidase